MRPCIGMARLRLPGLLLLACACAVSGGAARGAPFASTASPGDGKHGLLLEASVVLSSAAGATVDLASWSQHAWPQLDEAALFRSVQAEMPARSAAIAFAEADGVPRVDDVLARYAPPSMLPNGVRHASEAAAAAGLPPPLARAVRRSVLTAARTAAVWLKEEELEAEIGYKRIARALRRAGYEPSRPEMLGHNSWCTHAHNSHFAGRDWRAHRLASACSRHHRGLEWHEWLATWAASHSSLDDALHSPPPAAICSRRAAGAGLSLAKFMEDFCSAVYSDATDGSANLESPLSERQRREWALALHFIGEHLSNATSDPARLQTLRDHRKALTTKMFGYPPYHIMSPMSAFEDSLWHMAHDAEWLESLVETGRLPRPFLGLTYPLHLSIKQSLRSGAQPGGLFLLSHEIFPVIGASKGRRLYLETPRHVWGGMAAFRGDPFRSPYFMLNPRVNWVAAEQKYKEMEQLHGHGIVRTRATVHTQPDMLTPGTKTQVVIDDLLKPEALADLLSICQRSAAYFEVSRRAVLLGDVGQWLTLVKSRRSLRSTLVRTRRRVSAARQSSRLPTRCARRCPTSLAACRCASPGRTSTDKSRHGKSRRPHKHKALVRLHATPAMLVAC